MKGDLEVSRKHAKHLKKGLKADEILAQRSSIPAISIRKRHSDRTSDNTLPAKKPRADWVSHKDLARLKQVADGRQGIIVEAKDATYDIWDSGSAATTETQYDFLPLQEPTKQPKSLKQKPISLTANGKEVPAIPKPSGGYSYNPLSTDYEARLAEESAKALESERQRIIAEESEREKQEAAARSAAEAEAAEERANLSEWEEDSEWEGFQSGAEGGETKKKRPQRKTQAQRNRIKRRKDEERLAKQKATMKAMEAQAERIKDIVEEVEEHEQKRALGIADITDAETEGNDDVLRRKQLGKFKLPERDLELVLPDELEESLRLLKPEGSLLKDRYRSMFVRGKMECRRHIPFKKLAKRKATEKWTHKDFVL